MTGPRLAVVLAGGEGRRMGGGKPIRRFGETTLVARMLELARSYCPQVAVAVRNASQVAGAVDTQLLLDDPTIEGPLGGLASALYLARRLGAANVLTLPCDAPLLPQDLAVRLAGALCGHQGVAVAQSNGRLHPTCALWTVEVLDILPAYLASGRSSLKGLAAAADMVVVDWEIEGLDPFVNANTPEDLMALQPNMMTPRARL